MSNFNLEEALKGAKVVTRDGRDVKIAGYNPNATRGKLLGWVQGKCGSWLETGQYRFDQNSVSDLFMKPKPVESFHNVYYENNIFGGWRTLEDAINGGNKPTSVCKITIENGFVVSAETVHTY